MSDFSVSLDGLEENKRQLEALIDRVETEAVFQVGSTAEYAVYLEFGRGPVTPDSGGALKFEDGDGNTIFRSRVSGHQPYPFFRPALREFKANPETFVEDNAGIPVEQIDSGTGLLRAIALALENQIATNANANRGGRSPGTHPDHPVKDTGNLVASIQSERIR